MEFIIVTFIAWLTAQVTKFAINLLQAKKQNGTLKGVNLVEIFASGGMPSSHTATVVSMTTSIALNYGLKSPLLAVCGVFATIVIFDSMNVRKAVGDLTKKFNDLAWKYYEEHDEDYTRMKVVEGHSFTEVIAGAAVGFVVSFLIEGLPKFI